MEKVKVRSKQAGVIARHNNPPFTLRFDTTDTVHEVSKEVADQLLTNSTFELADKPVKKKKEVD